jgi:hypothetical protein
MQLPNSARLNRRTAHWIQRVAICLFALAFFLPACRDHRPTFNNKVDTYQGWECARLALMLTFSSDGYRGWGFLAVLSSWINPLTLLVFILSLANRLPRLRSVLAAAILVCLISTWVFFAAADLVPLIGHFLWAASAAAILAADTLALPKQTLPS